MKSFKSPFWPIAAALTFCACFVAGCADRDTNEQNSHHDSQQTSRSPANTPTNTPTNAQPSAHDQPAQSSQSTHADSSASSDQPDQPHPPAHLLDPPDDPRRALTKALDAGLLAEPAPSMQHLAKILRATGVAQASQVLVFSKTSLQHRLISPNNPRAIYFNDDCYIGYVPGGLVEYADADPDPAVVSGLFAIDLNHGKNAALQSDASCISCHAGSRTGGEPGLLVRSVFPDPDGHLITSAGSTLVGHDTPIDQRWGGWYVTGHSGNTHHRGNQVTIEQPNGSAYINNALGSNLTDLTHRFNTRRYLQPTSDIVALMVLEHQVQMHNLLTQGGASVRKQTQRSRALAQHLNEPFIPTQSDTLSRIIDSNARRIVEHLLFCEEVPLTDPIVGSEAFQSAFRANRREDTKGRSLKDFDLQTRLFKYRCSYMIYANAFEQMPDALRHAVIEKLRNVLTEHDPDPAYDHLSTRERRIIYRILVNTGVL